MTHPELSRLFQAERASRSGVGAAERGLSRFLAEVATQAAPVPVAASASKLAWTAVTKWILVGVAVGVGGSGAVAYTSAKLASTPEPARTSVAIVAPAAASVVALPNEAPAAAPIDEQQPSAPPVAPRVSSGSWSTSPPASASPLTFDDELRLIQRAKTELDARRPAQAKAWLAEHAQRFPNGAFAPDREALRVLAGCMERPDPARALQFATQHPGSPMNERLRRDCGASIISKSVNETAAPGEPIHE